MKSRWVVVAMIGVVTVGSVIGVYLLWGQVSEPQPHEEQPATLIVATGSLTANLSPTASATASLMSTATTTPSPTATVTLATRVAVVTLIMSEVTLPASPTPLPENLQILAEAPDPIEPLPNATLISFPYTDFTGWVRFESDHPAMHYIKGNWYPIGSLQASQGQYHYTEDSDAGVRFSFSGEAVRVRYVGFTNGGVWNVLLDGMIVDTIDSYAPSGLFAGTRVYYVGAGDHILELRNTTTANPASSGHMLAFDAVQVYQPDELTWIIPNGVLPSLTPTATLVPASEIKMIVAPPSPQATSTEEPIQLVMASLVLGYDENANGELDVSEGVRGISVRLVERGTNRVLAQGVTDEQGFAQVQAATNAPVLLVVPYLSQSWVVNGHSEQQFTLLLAAGNQPGLVP